MWKILILNSDFSFQLVLILNYWYTHSVSVHFYFWFGTLLKALLISTSTNWILNRWSTMFRQYHWHRNVEQKYYSLLFVCKLKMLFIVAKHFCILNADAGTRQCMYCSKVWSLVSNRKRIGLLLQFFISFVGGAI